MSSPNKVSASEVCGDEITPPTGNLSFRNRVYGPEANIVKEGREHLGNPLISFRVPKGPSFIQGPLELGEGEGGLPGFKSCEFKSGPKLETTGEGEGLLRDPECRASRNSSPVDQEEVGLDFLPQLSVEAMAIMKELTNLQTRRICRYPSPQACAAELAALWASTDETNNRGTVSMSSMEGKHVSAGSLYPRDAGRGRAWVGPRRGTSSKTLSSKGIQYPSSNPDSSDELTETQTMRVTICIKEGAQSKASGLSEPEDTARNTNVHGREGFVHVPPSTLSTATRALTSGLEKQASGELEGTMYKKKQSIVWGKEGSRHSYPGAAAICATAPATAASGTLPKTSLRKKQLQEKKSQSDASRGPLGRTFPPWGQRLKSAPVGPATLPPISGVALLGKGSKCSLPSGPKECKPFCTGKKSTAKKNKESQSGAKEDNDALRDLGKHAQPGCGGKWAWLPVWVTGVRRALTVWAALLGAEQPGVFMHRGDMVSGDTNFRVPQFPANSQLVALSQRGTRPRAPVPIGDQDRPMSSLLFVGESQPVVQGTPGCPQCLMLQKEIENLKEQLAVMKALNEKFQDL